MPPAMSLEASAPRSVGVTRGDARRRLSSSCLSEGFFAMAIPLLSFKILSHRSIFAEAAARSAPAAENYSAHINRYQGFRASPRPLGRPRIPP